MANPSAERGLRGLRRSIARKYGKPGTLISGGQILDEEYLPELLGQRRFEIYDRMRKSDPIVAAILFALKLPLMSAHWHICPSDINSEESKKVADFIEKCLMKNCNFRTVLDDSLQFLDFGVSVLEPVYTVEAGELILKKLMSIAPKSITGWVLDGSDSMLVSITQEYYGTHGKWAAEIPAKKCLVLTHFGNELNFEGVAQLRSMYKPWYFKTNVEKILAVSIERSEIGIPHAKYPQSTHEDTIAKLESALRNMVYHEQAYLTHPDNIEVDYLEANRRSINDILDFVRYQDQEMVFTALAQFLLAGTAGQSGVSSTAPHINLFLLAQQARARIITEAFNHRDPRIKNHTPVIDTLVRYNFGDAVAEKYMPSLAVSNIQNINLKVLAETLKDLTIAGVIEPDDEMENSVRRYGCLPEKHTKSARKHMTQRSAQGGMLSPGKTEKPADAQKKVNQDRAETRKGKG